MLGSTMMKVAESGRFAERRAMIQHFTTVLIRSEDARRCRPPVTEEGCRALVEHAALIVDMIEEVAHGR